MRKIIASEMVTLDGYFAGPNGELDWFLWNGEMAESAIELMRTIDTILFGRVTYELMADYWPKASPPEEDPVIIERMNNLPKIVFSRSLPKAEWNNSRLVKEFTAADIQALKNQPGKDMVIYGSGTIVTAFMNLGLIDEYYLLINPVALGTGKSFFQRLKDRRMFELLRTNSFSNGVVLHHYKTKT